MKTRIATIGSCVTRDNFNSIFNPNYKMFFDLVIHQHQVSIPSLMSKKINYVEDSSISNFSSFGKLHLKSECNKEFLKLIKQKKPEYLLIDLDGDVNFGLREIGNGEYFTNNPKFQNLSFLRKYNKKILLKDHTEIYFNLWKPKVNSLFSFLRKEVPNCKVILVKARFSDKFEDGTTLSEYRRNKNINVLDVDYMNSLWDKLDEYIIETFNVEVLDMTEKEYYLEPNHPWGPNHLHYKGDFYNDFFNKLQEIVQRDINDKLHQTKKRNITLGEKLKFYENESFIHVIKRYLLKNPSIKKTNDIIKRRNI